MKTRGSIIFDYATILDCVEGKGNPDPSGDYVAKSVIKKIYKYEEQNEILYVKVKFTRSMNREFYSYVLY